LSRWLWGGQSHLGLLALIPLAAGAGYLGLRALPVEREVASYVTPLDGRTRAQKHNARLSAQKLNGARIEADGAFSFNGRVGSYSRDAGYRKAPVSYNGQLIDDWGGGVCQTSTTLYNAALLAGMDVVERHRHQFQPTYVPPGRDAAVAYSNIDLKLRNPHPFPVRVEARVEGDMLRVALVGTGVLKERPQVYSEVLNRENPATFRMGDPGRPTRLRNSGKRGYEVAVYRITGDRRELVSHDSYPVMHRVLDER
jgi:vancomycin resistance protein VanW